MKKTLSVLLAFFVFASLGMAPVGAELTDEVATVTGGETQPAVASVGDAMSLNELENATEQTVKQDVVKPEKKEKKEKKAKKEKKSKKEKKQKKEKKTKKEKKEKKSRSGKSGAKAKKQ